MSDTEQKDANMYLDSEKKFPYKIDGRISGNLLKKAIQEGSPEVKKRAQSLYEDHCI